MLCCSLLILFSSLSLSLKSKANLRYIFSLLSSRHLNLILHAASRLLAFILNSSAMWNISFFSSISSDKLFSIFSFSGGILKLTKYDCWANNDELRRTPESVIKNHISQFKCSSQNTIRSTIFIYLNITRIYSSSTIKQIIESLGSLENNLIIISFLILHLLSPFSVQVLQHLNSENAFLL